MLYRKVTFVSHKEYAVNKHKLVDDSRCIYRDYNYADIPQTIIMG